MGYHQLDVSPESQEKLAFQGVDAIKWTYAVMPFGPTNGLAIFTTFIHDIDSIWKELAKQNGLPIDDDMNVTSHMVTNSFQERGLPIWEFFCPPAHSGTGTPPMVMGIGVFAFP
jgi:hypothetical protein